jgi:hypothetical protein
MGVKATRRQPTREEFVRRRLGPGNDLERLKRMFRRSFGAGSFGGFWRYWNPVYSYYLDVFTYRPLCKVFPRPLAVVATFACSGFLLHDLPFWWGIAALRTRSIPVPFVALWFALMAVLALVEARLGLQHAALPFRARVAINALHIGAAGAVAFVVVALGR